MGDDLNTSDLTSILSPAWLLCAWALESSLHANVWNTKTNETEGAWTVHIFFFPLCVLASVDIWITFFALGSCKNTLSGETQERMRLLCMTAMAFQPLPFPFRAAAAEISDVAGVLATYLLSFLRLLQSPKPGPLSSAPHLICASLPNDIH